MKTYTHMHVECSFTVIPQWKESNESSYEWWPGGDTEELYAHLSSLILLC